MSVVVALIAGTRTALARCLQDLAGQTGVNRIEVLVPYDETVADVIALAADFPSVQFLRAEGLETAAARAGASREHHDTLRTIGLRAARAPIIALTEDHARLPADWCAGLLAALDQHPSAGAAGGAVDPGRSDRLALGVYFCDFGRYQSPVPEGPAWFVSDSNVAYRRDALVAVAASWRDDYHETIVHDALRAAGWELRLTPRVVVRQQRDDLRAGPSLRERFVWGRSYASSRVRTIGAGTRLALALTAPVLAIVLTARSWRTAAARGRGREFRRALGWIGLLNASWAVGEWAGYLTGRA
jgi:GT2 family glycosyltransferase